MSKKIYGIPVSTPINPAKVYDDAALAGAVEDYMEEHPITAQSIGARPATWTPTAQEVGATPANHAENKNNPHGVTASQVGARPSTWLPTPAEIGALSGTDTTLSVPGRAADAGAVGNRFANLKAEDVGARPNTWMPTATEVGARPNTWLPTIAEIGAAPAGYGYGGEELQAMSATEAELETQFSEIINSMSAYSTKQVAFIVSDGALKGYGYFIGTIYKISNAYSVIRATSYADNGCIVTKAISGGIWYPFEWLKPSMQPGKEYRTTERWNSNPVYTKLFNIGGFTGVKNTTLTNGNLLIRAECVYLQDGKYCIATPYSYDYSNCTIIEINLGSGVTCDDAWFTAWYIKG